MAYLAELDTRLLLYIQDALRYEPLHSFWRGISFLGDLGWFWIFTGILLALNSKTRTAGITAIAALVLSTFISNVILKMPLCARARLRYCRRLFRSLRTLRATPFLPGTPPPPLPAPLCIINCCPNFSACPLCCWL